MPVRPAVRDWLEHVHVPCTALAHLPAFTAQEEAALAHVSSRDWAKTVVCFADEEPILAVPPGAARHQNDMASCAIDYRISLRWYTDTQSIILLYRVRG